MTVLRDRVQKLVDSMTSTLQQTGQHVVSMDTVHRYLQRALDEDQPATPDLTACGECSALTRPDDADDHAQWHQRQRDEIAAPMVDHWETWHRDRDET
jgi:hypothetical protein